MTSFKYHKTPITFRHYDGTVITYDPVANTVDAVPENEEAFITYFSASRPCGNVTEQICGDMYSVERRKDDPVFNWVASGYLNGMTVEGADDVVEEVRRESGIEEGSRAAEEFQKAFDAWYETFPEKDEVDYYYAMQIFCAESPVEYNMKTH